MSRSSRRSFKPNITQSAELNDIYNLYSLVRIMIMLPRNVATGLSFFNIFGFRNLILFRSKNKYHNQFGARVVRDLKVKLNGTHHVVRITERNSR